MSKPAPRSYHILNRVLSPSDEMLALTFHGVDNYVTVTPFNRSDPNQRWQIIDFDAKTQSVSPSSNTHIQIGWGSSGAIVLPNGDYVWTIRANADGTTIRDGNNTVYWGLKTAVIGETVGIGGGVDPSFGQRWFLEHA